MPHSQLLSMGKKTKILLLLSIFCIISTCSAGDWTRESVSTLTRCNLSGGSDIIRVIDFNDDAVFISLIRDNQVIESAILESSVLMDDGLIKVVHTTSYSGKRFITVYSKNVPRFTVSTDTKEQFNGYKSKMFITCVNAPAYNVKYYLESENVKMVKKYRPVKYNKLDVDTETERCIRYSLNENPSVNLTIEYEDDLGNEYVQKFDVLKNLPVKVVHEPTEPVKGGYTIIRRSVEDREKEIFYRAIERALNHIDFSAEAEAELRSIQKQLE